MKTKILYGKPVADYIKEEAISLFSEVKDKKYIHPAVVYFNNEDSGTISYIKGIKKNFEKIDVNVKLIDLSTATTPDEVRDVITTLNAAITIQGIMVLRPLPEWLDESVFSYISPIKNIEHNATADAVLRLLDYYDYSVEGKNAVVIGRTHNVGEAIALKLLSHDATVTICHSKSENTVFHCMCADIIITATNQPEEYDNNYFNTDSIVVDVGTCVNKDGKLCGNVDFENVKDTVTAITPVPNGVGAVTSAVLLHNFVTAVLSQNT